MNNNRIFICHANEDKKHALEIYYKLKEFGYSPWLDKMDLLPGQDWDKEIRKALKLSRFVLILFSNNSTTKRGYVQREFKLALNTLEEIPEGDIFIIPIKLDNCNIPNSFERIHFINLYEEDSFEKIKKAIVSQAGLPNQFIDIRDNQVYDTVEINGLRWMKQNLNFDVGEECWNYDNNPKNGKLYGRLYTWKAAKLACPPNWRIPTDKEWSHLSRRYGGYSDRLQVGGYDDWNMELDKEIGYLGEPLSGFRSEIGFNLKFSGKRSDYKKNFIGLGKTHHHWTSSEKNEYSMIVYEYVHLKERKTRYEYDKFTRYISGKSEGISLRCVQDIKIN